MYRFFLLIMALCAVCLLAASSAMATDLPVSGTASASSSASRNPARHMNDGNSSTYWIGSSTAAQTVTLDLGSAKTLTASRVDWKASRTAAFRLFGSADGSTWTQLADQSANTAKSTTTAISGSYRYLRMTIPLGSVGIFEWRTYASTPTPTPTPTASATPTPTPTASATPTPTASATPTPTASATPTPTASADPAQPVGSISVASYGAKGDGVTNDLSALSAAVTVAGSGGTVYLPAGTYYLASAFAPTAKVTFAGAGMGVSVISGHLDFGSGQLYRDLSIRSAANSAAKNQSGSSGTTFQRVSFRGGGVAATGKAPVIALGGAAGPVAGLHFIGCQFDRTLGTENASHSNGFNIVSMGEVLDDAAHLQSIHFEGCTFGTSNGVATGSPRMGIELTSRLWNGGAVQHYAKDIVVSGCTFEFMDETAIDIESSVDTGSAPGNFTITGNLIKGVGTSASLWANGICLESGQYALVQNNTIYGCKYGSISIDDPGQDCYAQVTGNTIDDTKGYPSVVAVVTITENQVTFTGNSITTGKSNWLTNSGSDNTVSANTVNGVLR